MTSVLTSREGVAMPCSARNDGRVDDLTRLAVAAGRGDRRALDEFVRRAQPDVWRLCAYLGDRDTADDLAQETFVQAVRALPRFRAESGARSWLLAIARHTCADHVRRRTRDRRLFDRLAGGVGNGTTPGPAAVELTELVEGLPFDRREAFVLTQLLGLSYEEAAEVSGCPVGTIRSRVARARAQLIEHLADRPPSSRRCTGCGPAGDAGPCSPRSQRQPSSPSSPPVPSPA